MTNKSGRTRQSTNDLRDELIWGLTLSGDKGVSLGQQNDIVVTGIFNKKKKVLQSSML